MAEPERPLCKCHREPMYWVSRRERKSGGNWTCAVRDLERKRRWRTGNPEKDREHRLRYEAKRRGSRQEYNRRWEEEHREERREYKRRYQEANSKKIREAKRCYREKHYEEIREYRRLHREELILKGLCIEGCGRPLATATRCNECADKKITPWELLKTRRRQALKRKAARHQTKPEVTFHGEISPQE